jgi:lipopolysaccharide biosynthesis protein
MTAKIVALYFPQLHPIPENDRWWGKGFTDWANVKRARPLYPGHYQPRVPLRRNYYDQSQFDVIRRQVELAKAYGIHGFCHYHYWFDGKQLLETPTNLFLAAKELDFRFCLAWANETWSKRWDGQDHYILQAQTHPEDPDRWELHFKYLIKAWADDRSIRIDGKPLFLIYRPQRIPNVGRLFEYWRARARDHGLPGVYFAGITQHLLPDAQQLKHFDAMMLFQPFVGYFNNFPRVTPRWMHALARVRPFIPRQAEPLAQKLVDLLIQPTRVDYDAVWRAIIDWPVDRRIPQFLGAYVDWDNTARYRNRATVFEGATPERFGYWMRKLLARASENREEEQLVFVNAWNEWAEGAYLEPDERYGYAYLEALKRAILEHAEDAGGMTFAEARQTASR